MNDVERNIESRYLWIMWIHVVQKRGSSIAAQWFAFAWATQSEAINMIARQSKTNGCDQVEK